MTCSPSVRRKHNTTRILAHISHWLQSHLLFLDFCYYWIWILVDPFMQQGTCLVYKLYKNSRTAYHLWNEFISINRSWKTMGKYSKLLSIIKHQYVKAAFSRLLASNMHQQGATPRRNICTCVQNTGHQATYWRITQNNVTTQVTRETQQVAKLFKNRSLYNRKLNNSFVGPKAI